MAVFLSYVEFVELAAALGIGEQLKVRSYRYDFGVTNFGPPAILRWSAC